MERSDRTRLIVVLDTNVVLSYFWSGATISTVFDALFEGRFTPAVSKEMLDELLSVGCRPKFRTRFTASAFDEICSAYCQSALRVTPRRPVRVSPDIKDNIFLECALEAQADYLVSGDSHLLDIGVFGGTAVVTPATFVKMAL